MQSPAIWGVLMAMAAVIAAYWMGHSAGFQAGQGEGFDEGKREGAKEGSMRGYAVGFDRGKRGQADDGGGREASSRLGFGIVGLVLAAFAVFTLASNSQRSGTISSANSRTRQSLQPNASANFPFGEKTQTSPGTLLEGADPLRSPQSSGNRRLIPVQEEPLRNGLSNNRALIPVPTTGPLMKTPQNQNNRPDDPGEFDLPPIQPSKPTW